MGLPVEQVLEELQQRLTEHPSVVLQAPPGAGKTSLVPLALLQADWLQGQKIILLEPRRLAARAAAERLAELLGEPVGQRVGYRIRLESRVSADTRIEVVTEGILQRLLQADPELPGIGLVIFDEFHERSLDADLGLALCLQSQQLLRDDLRLLVMSATLDGAAVSQLLNHAPVVASEGRQYPVTVNYLSPYQPGTAIEPRVVQAVQQALAETRGSVLVFLPGVGEIRRVESLLADALERQPDILLAPLYGDLDFAAQRRAIQPAVTGQRKVVLATSIAETSLTIEGIDSVVDAGLARSAVFDPVSGMTRLQTQRVSRAAAEQRAGRAGRLGPGYCYRLWSEQQQSQLAAQTPAEMLQADLAPLALLLAQWGIQDPLELAWLDAPPAAALQQGRELLERLGALERRGESWLITEHGQAMAALPMHPRLAHMLLRGRLLGYGELAAQLAALISERDVLRGVMDADISRRLALFSDARSEAGIDRGAWQRVKQLAAQWHRMLASHAASIAPIELTESAAVGVLLALAYPDRIAQRRGDSGSDYRLANGRAAAFGDVDALQQQPWLVISALGGHRQQRNARIFQAAALDLDALLHCQPDLLQVQDTLEWDARSETLLAERQQRLGALVVSRESLPELDPEQRNRALCAVVRKQGLNLLPWIPVLRQWQARVALLRSLELEAGADSQWPDLSDVTLLDSLEDWLAPYLDNVSRLSHFARLDLASILYALLPWPLPQQLELQAPTHWRVPTGSRIRIDYLADNPVLAVRLQELFGSRETPRIAGGRVSLTLHLLSPAQRPLQITQDLVGFWQGSYAEVKKDMKGRYPKHYWPDDPLQAEPTRRARPRT
ncbi:ATP-dependent helicase HrpB [Halopseudomonas salegens]|uniref:ATP-dependent helicase HrpB n=1 Tax=Halopseudomonas salegens TaxID=1434072 RepID=A0A1H2EKE8_9GAMM|nr:ATP-dependent helicase HrpB [Halopseudomonas salegens]SDT95606.1 ATP-dependent helicase HrpB [Halopseudomonas salegens]